jgi:hypothetical protein
MPSIEYRPDRPKPYRARYWGPDGRLHSRSFARKDDAQRWLTSEEASKLRDAWVDPRGSRKRFDDWASEWWELWASEPRRSPATLQAAEGERLVPVNPVRKVRAPKRPVDPEVVSAGSGAAAPTRPRSWAGSWSAARCSTGTTSSSRSAPACAAGSCSGCADAASTRSCGASRSSRSATTPAGSGRATPAAKGRP